MSRTILLIDDDEDTAVILGAFLHRQGYAVLVARDGEEGLEAARRHLPDLILLDVAIPKLNGWEVARRLRAEDATCGIPMLAVTALGMAADRAMAESLALDGYYLKPIEPSRLVAEVQRFFSAEA